MPDFDWNQLRTFLAAAEAGTLSGAARRLGQSQPTASRQVAALEASLGVTLFERAGKALVLTQAGAALLAFWLLVTALNGGVYRPRGFEPSVPAFWSLPALFVFPAAAWVWERRSR